MSSGVTETGVGRLHGAGHGQDPGGDVLGPDHVGDTQGLDQPLLGGEGGARVTDVAAAAVAPAADRAAHPADEGVDVAVRVGVTPPHPRAAAHPVGQRRRRKGGAGLPVEAAPAPMLGAQVEVAVAVRTVPARMAVTALLTEVLTKTTAKVIKKIQVTRSPSQQTPLKKKML